MIRKINHMNHPKLILFENNVDRNSNIFTMISHNIILIHKCVLVL